MRQLRVINHRRWGGHLSLCGPNPSSTKTKSVNLQCPSSSFKTPRLRLFFFRRHFLSLSPCCSFWQSGLDCDSMIPLDSIQRWVCPSRIGLSRRKAGPESVIRKHFGISGASANGFTWEDGSRVPLEVERFGGRSDTWAGFGMNLSNNTRYIQRAAFP